jgi:predicted ATPase
MNIVLVGAHGVGKTSLGRALAERLGVPFDHEIGAELAADATWRAPGIEAHARQAAFDVEVVRRELERDAVTPPGTFRVVETWHPGNLAYADLRGTELTRSSLLAVRRSVATRLAVVVPLVAPPEVLRARASESGDPRFFDAVGQASAIWAARLGLPVTRPLWTHRATPHELADEVLRYIEEVPWNASS